jgi:hypothetical protein
MTEIYCSVCDLDFEAYQWEDGECPNCGREYTWDEICDEDYTDCWVIVEWGPIK